jgi:alcohol dehydrogenase class IV
MKLAGEQLMFGQGCLSHLNSLKGKRAFIVSSRSALEKSGTIAKINGYLSEAGIESRVYTNVEPDPSFATVYAGAQQMCDYEPDWIIAVGGGSAMDAAKAMWIYYEHPELNTLAQIVPPSVIPKLRNKAKLVCIPSTSGSASEVSRSIVITDEKTGFKYGIGNMQLMPDIAICDPEVTATMPKTLTAHTGMDALTHALEAYVSQRANYLSDILAVAAAKDIFKYIKRACDDGNDMVAREHMLNASMTAGLAFTNVSLGIVHSMAHTLGSYFKIPHGLGDAIILPYVIAFNNRATYAKDKYDVLARMIGADSLAAAVSILNQSVGIASCFKDMIDKDEYDAWIEDMTDMALADGCTKTNPVVPTRDEQIELFRKIYEGV